MLGSLAKKIFGSSNDRLVASLSKEVAAINALEPKMAALSDAELRGKTDEFKKQLADGAALDSLMVPAFAVVREAAKRALGMRPFDVQLVGGMVLHKGMISEMRTGEGKTLVATLPSYLNALTGKGVHVVTVNDYLAERDSAWMGKLHTFLGLTVGTITSDMEESDRRAAYACDITYGTNNEYGFDYLRDNMKYSREQMVQRGFNYAIVDEVDSILIDEARTPLIISGPTEDNSDLYIGVNRYIPQLTPADYELDEKSRNVTLNDKGVEHMEALLAEGGLLQPGSGLYDIENVAIVHHVTQALRAHTLFKRDTDYIVKDNKVIIIDEFTGRMMDGRRYSEGLHQALEAKEKVEIQNENQTLASITFQNYFRLYPKLAGMTGTAMTEAGEFSDIYKLDVVEIPTNVGVARKDAQDEIYRTSDERDTAVIRLIAQAYARKQPVLVGTVSIEKSESFSARLKDRKFLLNLAARVKTEATTAIKAVLPAAETPATELNALMDQLTAAEVKPTTREHISQLMAEAEQLEKLARTGIDHQVLNARYHEQEAYIVSQAGQPGAVTIATNMAGRGTDIKLGGGDDMLIDIATKDMTDDAQIAQASEKIRREIATNKVVVKEAGGLLIIGTERHESRRIDNQLRGRSGRQGDEGASKFFLSLQDDLMRIFGSERIDAVLVKLGLQEGEAIIHPWMSKAIERAQTKVEQRNYEIRKNLLKFDDVMNDQRKVIYEQRIELMEVTDVRETIIEMRKDVNENLVTLHVPPQAYAEAWDVPGLHTEILRVYGLDLPVKDWAAEEGIAHEEILHRVQEATDRLFAEKAASFPPDIYQLAEKRILLETLDQLWKDHLLSLDQLRQGINLRAYAQKDPLNEYKQEAFTLFESMLNHLREAVISRIARVQIRMELTDEIMNLKPQQNMQATHADPAAALAVPQAPAQMLQMPPKDDAKKYANVGRNEPCPCGSGKKFKYCHGAIA